ncbi:MAG: hypothetical protein KDK70_05450 [Myxococcales bacterium]|nr:hypothetical protein [Myxococcales bacterium]
MTAQGYFDEDDRWVSSEELVGLDASGKPAPLYEPTLDEAQDLTEVEPEALLDCSTDAIYALDGASIDPALRAGLDAGKLFRFAFNARQSHTIESAYLVANEHGTFAIVGRDLQIPWCELEKPAVEIDEDEGEDDGELDFEMF